jgi:hypothetical protein
VPIFIANFPNFPKVLTSIHLRVELRITFGRAVKFGPPSAYWRNYKRDDDDAEDEARQINKIQFAY